MGTRKSCPHGGETKDNGNCTVPGPDGLPVQCVGPWAEDKHDYVQRFIEASRGARTKYLTPKGRRPAGGAAYIELFAGPGMARVSATGDIIDGSPLVAAKHAEAPFTRLIFADKEQENIDALDARLTALSRRAQLFCGDSNKLIGELGCHVYRNEPTGPGFGDGPALTGPLDIEVQDEKPTQW